MEVTTTATAGRGERDRDVGQVSGGGRPKVEQKGLDCRLIIET